MGKQNKGGGGGGGAQEDVKREIPLQAVIFADSFTRTFRPITLDAPKVLLPLVNVPMLEYTIEFLALSGVEEIIVFCISYADEIRGYLKTAKCSKSVSIQCISSPLCFSAGDALRELDHMQLIRSDPFILIPGDVVSNMDLKQAILEHKERTKADSSSIMTIVLKKACVRHPNRQIASDLVVAYDDQTSQILMFDDQKDNKKVSLSTEFLKEHPCLKMRYDLLDCHIDICSPEVLVQFSDNFDYQDIRRDFVFNEVQNFELGHKIHAKIINQDYAARIHDPYTYDLVFQDIVHRWTYPMVPEYNLLGDSTYTYKRGNVYKEQNVVLSRSSKIGHDTVLGEGTTVAEQCFIARSSMGKNCRIGNRVKISGSHLWNDVIVEDDVQIDQAIVCSGAVIRRGAVIEKGCVVSFGVVIGEGFRLAEFSKITKSNVCLTTDEQDFADDAAAAAAAAAATGAAQTIEPCNALHVGHGGLGRVWVDEDEELDSDEEGTNAKEGVASRIRSTLIGGNERPSEALNSDDDWEGTMSDDDNESLEDANDEERVEDRFARIVGEMVQSGDRSVHSVDDIFLEIKSFKFAQDRSFTECIQAILPALLDLIECAGKSTMEIVSGLRSKLERWAPVIKRCIIAPVEEMALVEAIEEYSLYSSKAEFFRPIFRFVLQTVYDMDVISDEIILQWHAARKALESDSLKRALCEDPKVQEFIEWLQDEDEDDSDEDEDEDD